MVSSILAALTVSSESFPGNLLGLDLVGNNISAIEEGPFPKKLHMLALQDNRIATLRSLDARRLRNLFLDGNGIREIAPGAFDGLPRLEHVWLGRNEIDRVSARAALPAGAKCIEDHCDEGDRGDWSSLGNGWCDFVFDTPECAWDGGDC